MSQLIIDVNAEKPVLRACRNMLNELLGECTPVVLTNVNEISLTSAEHGIEDVDTDPAHRGKATGPSTGTETRVDTLGVVFDPEYCGEATEPFYTSSKRAGQWKKRRGITDDAYDGWYAGRVSILGATDDTGEGKEPELDTGPAFGGGVKEPAGEPIPQDCGAFMGWVSAQQAAGKLSQQDIGNAYAQAGVQVTDLFPPNDAATVQSHVAKLYQLLVVVGGA
jgi:hypothetical protein